MAAAQFETWVDVNLQAGVRRVAVPEGFFTQDHLANKLGVRVYNGAEPVNLYGDIRWHAKLADGTTVSDDGEIIEYSNMAYAILKSEAYACVGPIIIAIQNIDGDDKTVLAVFTGYVHETITDQQVIPGNPVPDIDTLLAEIGNLREATTAANNLVLVQTTQPDESTGNKLWVQPQSNEYQVPTYEEFQELEETVDGLSSSVDELIVAVNGRLITNEVKNALLACFENLAWTTGEGQAAYDALVTALEPPVDLLRITAVYTQLEDVYTNDSLLTLRNNLVVTAYYTNGESSRVMGYTLSGVLTEGVSTILVTYGNKTVTFNVNVIDSALIYALPEEVIFTGSTSEIIDTGVVVIPSDRDTTFLIDFTPDTPASNGTFLFYTGMIVSPYNCVTIKCYTAGPRVESHSSSSGYKLTNASYGNRIHLAIRYTQGASKLDCDYRAGNNAITSGTSANTGIISASTTLTIGGVNSSFAPYAGKISAFRVYSRRLSDDEVTTFLNEGVA